MQDLTTGHKGKLILKFAAPMLLGNVFQQMFISLLSLWIIRIPMACYLSGKVGAIGIWWAIPSGSLIGFILLFIYYKSGRWKRKSIVKYSDNL